MKASYLDETGQTRNMEMGCYGIGISRIVAAAIEQNHDEHGIIFPDAIAPFQLVIVPIGLQKSTLVREAVEKLYRQLTEARIEVLGKLFASIHQDLTFLGRSYEECAGMGATLSLCRVAHDQIYFAHVGDSRIYHFPVAGGCIQLTNDHNHVGWLRRTGRINEREARSHPMRHTLHQAMGAGIRNIDPQLGVAPYSLGDRFLLCSDGVTDGLWDRNLDELIRESPSSSGKSVAQRIVEEAVEKSGRDNATALVVEFLPPESPAS